MNFEKITEIAMEMTLLPFFPSEPAARLAIVRMIGAMAQDEAQVRWLIGVMTSGAFAKWEGPAELRAVFCMKFRPKDGIEAVSSVYPDGMSREQLNPGKRLEIAAQPVRLLVGDVLAEAPELAEPLTLAVRNTSLAVRVGHVEPSIIRADENEYDALLRRVAECKREPAPDPLASVRPATDVEIEALKTEQQRNRKRPELAVCE